MYGMDVVFWKGLREIFMRCILMNFVQSLFDGCVKNCLLVWI